MHNYINGMIGIMLTVTTMAQASDSQLFEPDSKLERIVCAYKAGLPCIGSTEASDDQSKARTILHLLGQFRPPPSRFPFCMGGEEELIVKIARLMEQGKQLKLVLPSFPIRSMNTEKKVLSLDPDLGELVSLITLNHVCEQISQIYPPGAEVTLLTDGVYCTEALGLKEDEALMYENKMKRLIAVIEVDKHVKLLSLAELPDTRVNGKSYEELRLVLDRYQLQNGVDYKPQQLTDFCLREVDCAFYKSLSKAETLEKTKALKPYKNLPEEVQRRLVWLRLRSNHGHR